MYEACETKYGKQEIKWSREIHHQSSEGQYDPQAPSMKKNCPGFAAMRTMALSFQGILQNGTVDTLHGWLVRATASGLHSSKQFARTLRQDLPAVEAAILQKWSNGPVEGHVNRLKTIKRQMYGRAGIDLLRARLVLIPA